MDRKDLENLIIEMGCLALVGECRAFSNYFNIDYINITYKLNDNKAYVYITDKEETTLLTELDFKEAVIAWRNPSNILSAPFDKIIEKYQLTAEVKPIEITPTIVDEGEQQDEIETI